jgi:hypothetical protein
MIELVRSPDPVRVDSVRSLDLFPVELILVRYLDLVMVGLTGRPDVGAEDLGRAGV